METARRVQVGSAPKTLNKTDWPHIAKSFGIGLLIAMLIYIGEFVKSHDFGEYTAILVGIVPVLITGAVRWLKDNTDEGEDE